MNETIRDVLKRRVRWCAAIGAVGFATFIAVPLATIRQHGQPPVPVILLAWCLFVGAMVGLQWFAARCPKCSRRMGQEIAMRVGLAIRGKPPNYCPYCGVSFDEPLPSTKRSIESQNPLNPIK